MNARRGHSRRVRTAGMGSHLRGRPGGGLPKAWRGSRAGPTVRLIGASRPAGRCTGQTAQGDTDAAATPRRGRRMSMRLSRGIRRMLRVTVAAGLAAGLVTGLPAAVAGSLDQGAQVPEVAPHPAGDSTTTTRAAAPTPLLRLDVPLPPLPPLPAAPPAE